MKKPETTRVRILVATTDGGAWVAEGASDQHAKDTKTSLNESVEFVMTPPIWYHWIEADVPCPPPAPKPPVIQGKVRSK